MFLKTYLLTFIVYFHSWLSILLMLAYMGTVIVILLNILIAQMSTTYTQAKRVARLEYDVDRILLLTRMERFPLLVSHIWEGWSERGLWIISALARDANLKFQSCYEHEKETNPSPRRNSYTG